MLAWWDSVDGGGGNAWSGDKYACAAGIRNNGKISSDLIRVGKNSARVTARARILLKSDDDWAAPQGG